MTPSPKLTGRVAIVTGAAGGIGRAVARRFAAEGASLALMDLDEGGLEEVSTEIRNDGGEVVGIPVDLTSWDATVEAFRKAETLGGPDVLVNNAGWDRLAFFAETSPDFWYRVIDVNLKGTIHATRAALDRMIPRERGRIVSVSSDAGRVGSSGEAVYSGCKAGIIGFSKAIAREVARQGITVNVVCPGPTETPLLEEVRKAPKGDRIVEGMRRAIPLGRLGRPEDLPGAILFFASDDASFVTGQVLSVSGGLTMAG